MRREFTGKDTQIVKGFAVLSLLFYHLFENAQRVTSLNVDYRPFSLDTFLLLSGFGNICVAVFAFLSAYGITKGIMNRGDEVGLRNLYGQATGRYCKLTANFLTMFLSINLLWFSKFDYKGLYGTGWQGGLYAVLDALGLAEIFDTPTINGTWWYMELAVLIIFVVPLLYYAAGKLGAYLIPIAVLLPVVVEMNYDVKRYYIVALFGVLAATEGWLDKLLSVKKPYLLQAVVGVILFGGLILFRQNYVVYNEFGYLVDAPIALFVAWFGASILGRIPGVNYVLAFLGKHSMNIYFVHTFFYMAIHQEFVYSFRYAGLIFVVLVVVSLLYSVVLEGIKSLLRFQKAVGYMEKHLKIK